MLRFTAPDHAGNFFGSMLGELLEQTTSVGEGNLQVSCHDTAAIWVAFFSRRQRYRGGQESANCRMEANYAHQQGLDMIPLMMEKGYRAKGWLGLCVHTRTDVYAQPADPLCLLPPEF